MNVVNFAEGILGIDQNTAPVVAKCLRNIADTESTVYPERSFGLVSMISVANQLESGARVDIELIQLIGEKRLSETKRLFLNAS